MGQYIPKGSKKESLSRESSKFAFSSKIKKVLLKTLRAARRKVRRKPRG